MNELLDESTDDPDSFSIPVLHLSPTDEGVDYRLKESNDYDDEDEHNHHHQQQHQYASPNQIVPELISTVPAPCGMSQTVPSWSPIYMSKNTKQIEEVSRSDEPQMSTKLIDRSSTRSSFVRNGSVRHHRSTPNLANLEDESPTQNQSPVLIMNDLNDIKPNGNTFLSFQ